MRNNDYTTDSFNARMNLFLPTEGTLTAGWDYVDNITDEEYEMCAGYPMAGITAGISGKLSF